MRNINRHKKTGIALIWGLFLCLGTGFSQNSLNTQKVVIFKDLAQITQKGILRFDKSVTDVEIKLNPIPESVEFRGTGEFKIAWYKFREDSVAVKQVASNWAEILQASIGRNLTIVYQIGSDFDEVEGTVGLVNIKDGFVILNSTRGTDFIIPIDQVRQVIVGNAGKLEIEKKVAKKMVRIGIQEDVPFVPLEMTCLHEGISWEPVCRIKLQNTSDALVLSSALIRNDAIDMNGVEVELSPSSALKPGETGEAISIGKISLTKGEFITVNLNQEEVSYNESREVSLPWEGVALRGPSSRIEVDHLLSFDMPEIAGLECSSLSVLDAANRHVANLNLDDINNGKVRLVLEKDKDFQVSLTETIKKEGKTVKTSAGTFVRSEVEGKISVFNGKKNFAEIFISREIDGEPEDTGKGNVSDGRMPGKKIITWKQTLGGGDRKDLIYTYETLVPVGE